MSESRSVVSDCLQPHGLYSPWNSPAQNTGMGNLSLLQGIFPTQESNENLLHCRRILYQLGHQGKSKNTGVGSLSLLQQIFLTQESNWGLLNCRQILYQLSYQESPISLRTVAKNMGSGLGPSDFNVQPPSYWPRLNVFDCELLLKITLLKKTLCEPIDCSTLGFPVLHYFPEFSQTLLLLLSHFSRVQLCATP